MKLYSGKVPIIAEEVVRALTAANDIETEDPGELRLDVEAVLKEYLRAEREIDDLAKRRLESSNLPHTQFGRAKKSVADSRGIGIGEDAIDHILNQLVSMLMHSARVDEVFAEDHELRARMTPILRKHMALEDDIDREVRGRLKNLVDGSRDFEIQYAKTLEEIKRKRGL